MLPYGLVYGSLWLDQRLYSWLTDGTYILYMHAGRDNDENGHGHDIVGESSVAID